MALPIPKCPVAAVARQEGASEPEGGEAPRVHVPTSVNGREEALLRVEVHMG